MSTKDHDPVHNPRHYTSGAVECIDAIESALGPEGFIAFLRGQVIKYNWRMGQKDAPVQEADKAKWYMDKLAKALGAGTANWPQSPTQSQSIQGAALTDKKEIQNGRTEQLLTKRYGTFPKLCARYGSLLIRNDSNGHYVFVDSLGRVVPQP